jgi:hypothetical protein
MSYGGMMVGEKDKMNWILSSKCVIYGVLVVWGSGDGSVANENQMAAKKRRWQHADIIFTITCSTLNFQQGPCQYEVPTTNSRKPPWGRKGNDDWWSKVHDVETVIYSVGYACYTAHTSWNTTTITT